MKAFSNLYNEIDQTTSINEKMEALQRYFTIAPAEDAVWAVALLIGKRPKRTVKSSELWKWCAELTHLPSWLISESYHVVGDMAETIALLLPSNDSGTEYSLHVVISNLIQLENKQEEERKSYITSTWRNLSSTDQFIFNKLITGGFRMGVSAKIIIKALAKFYAIEETVIAHRLSGKWDPQSITLNELILQEGSGEDLSKPYPFYLAYPLEIEPVTLGSLDDWIVERKYDGIRGQIIVRDKQLFVWSRGEDLLTDKFIEFHPLAKLLPNGTVIDGEILPLKNGNLLPFHLMQTRIGRKNISKKILEEVPLVMICYDLLEYEGEDIRHLPLFERRHLLETIINQVSSTTAVPLQLSPIVEAESWNAVAEEREHAREFHCEGLMLKRKSSEYKTGRKKGDWWKWKIDPLTIDGVLIYAQRGHGRRANLYTDFTFAVWDGEELVPFTKAYSGLTDKELTEADTWIRKHTKEKFGPVRSVTPELVFEIGFEGINPSPRHKSGIALRFPRILRWRKDKGIKDANTKSDLLDLLANENKP